MESILFEFIRISMGLSRRIILISLPVFNTLIQVAIFLHASFLHVSQSSFIQKDVIFSQDLPWNLLTIFLIGFQIFPDIFIPTSSKNENIPDTHTKTCSHRGNFLVFQNGVLY